MTIRFFTFVALFFSLVTTHAAETMFEGYYRVDLHGKHVGYVIQRFEFDKKTKTFISKSFMRAKFGDTLMQESVVSKGTDSFKPLAYEYTSNAGKAISIIDAKFKGQIMTASINDGKVVKTETSKLLKDTILSSFMPYIILNKPIEVHGFFDYNAVAEEKAGSWKGKVLYLSKEPKPGYSTVTIRNEFMGQVFISKMAIVQDPKTKNNIKGEVLSTSSQAQGVSTHLVASPALATAGQVVPNKTLIKIFGNVPTGKLNLVASPSSVTPVVPNVEPGPSIIPTPVPPTDDPPPNNEKTGP